MSDKLHPVRDLSDEELLGHTLHLAADERRATRNLIEALTEVDRRGLFLGLGCSSLFTYCTQVLHLSEHAAYTRIQAARAARRYPIILDLFRSGEITLTTISLLAAHLTPDNYRQLLETARRKSRREVEWLVAGLRPRADKPSIVRRLTEPHGISSAEPQPELSVAFPTPDETMLEGQAESDPQPVHADVGGLVAPLLRPSEEPTVTRKADRSTIAPLSPERYRIQITVGAATYARLCRAQDLMRHVVPNGDPALVIDRALIVLVDMLERRKLAAAARPIKKVDGDRRTAMRSRYVPAPIRREVWSRDGGRCAFVGTQGRCLERGGLEFHHLKPYARGGATSIENLELRCRAHNQYEGQQIFGARDAGRVVTGPDTTRGAG